MRDFLLVIWIATIGADRVDLLGGHEDFRLTPFLLLSLLVIGVEVVHAFMHSSVLGRDTALKLPKNSLQFLILVNAFLLAVALSVFINPDSLISMKRFFLLLAEVYFSILIAIILYNKKNPERILLLGAYAGISLSCVFSGAQLLNWLLGQYGDALLREPAFINLIPQSYGNYAPRLAGVSTDMNRGGMLLVFYSFLVFKFGGFSKARIPFLYIAFILLMLTLSRSALLAYVLMITVLLLQRGSLSLTALRRFVVGLVGAASFLVMYIAINSQIESRFNFGAILAERASTLVGGTSGRLHLELIERGLSISTSSVKNFLFGIGFGNSFMVLNDFFPGDKYGNFHSIYVSLLAEAGIVSLLLFLLLSLYPFLTSKQYIPLMVGILVFNVLYQLTLEPVLWFCIALFWMNIGFKRSQKLSPKATQNVDSFR